MNNLSYMGLTLAGEDLLLEAQAKSARGLIAYWLKAFEDAVIKDQKLSTGRRKRGTENNKRSRPYYSK